MSISYLMGTSDGNSYSDIRNIEVLGSKCPNDVLQAPNTTV